MLRTTYKAKRWTWNGPDDIIGDQRQILNQITARDQSRRLINSK